jgi:hypothetical protein
LSCCQRGRLPVEAASRDLGTGIITRPELDEGAPTPARAPARARARAWLENVDDTIKNVLTINNNGGGRLERGDDYDAEAQFGRG